MENDPKAAGRHRRTGEEVSRLVNEFRARGLRAEAFCRQHGLAVSTLRRRLKRAARPAGPGDAGVRLVAVKLNGALRSVDPKEGPAALEVRVAGGRRIGVAPGFDAATLGRWVRALEGL